MADLTVERLQLALVKHMFRNRRSCLLYYRLVVQKQYVAFVPLDDVQHPFQRYPAHFRAVQILSVHLPYPLYPVNKKSQLQVVELNHHDFRVRHRHGRVYPQEYAKVYQRQKYIPQYSYADKCRRFCGNWTAACPSQNFTGLVDVDSKCVFAQREYYYFPFFARSFYITFLFHRLRLPPFLYELLDYSLNFSFYGI